MELFIIGATGFVGARILEEALTRNHHITALIRDPGKIRHSHPNLKIIKGDIYNEQELVHLLTGHDAVVSAYNPGWKHPQLYHQFLQGAKLIQQATKEAGIPRLLVVGGAGSLELDNGLQWVDAPEFPEQWKEGALAARDYLSELRKENELDWVLVSPAIEMHPGTSGIRTGTYRVGKDQPVFNQQGVSRISVEDIAVAILDEIERPHFHQKRFTVAW